MLSAAAFPVVTETKIATGMELNVSVSGGEQVMISQSAAGITVTQVGTPTFLSGDLNQDGLVNFGDLSDAVQIYGTAGPNVG